MKIIFACSGSGGHLFPAICVAEEINKRDSRSDILFITERRKTSEKILSQRNFKYILFPVISAPNLLNCISFVIKTANASVRSLIVLKKFRPNLLIGFGGFVSCPLLVLAKLLGIPVLIHEQNVMPGRANLLLSKIADRIAVSFDDTKGFFRKKDKLVLTGNPIRDTLHAVSKKEGLTKFGFIPEHFTLLVMGGSQGAGSINKAIMGAFERFSANERSIFQVVHIAGERDYSDIQNKYKALQINSRVYNFLDRMDYAYAASDLIISRAGATAVSEILSLAKSAIFVPYPHARSHQLGNARYAAKVSPSAVLTDDEHLDEGLYSEIYDFYSKRDSRQLHDIPKEKKWERNPAQKIADLAFDFSKR